MSSFTLKMWQNSYQVGLKKERENNALFVQDKET